MAVNFDQVDAMLRGLDALNSVVTSAYEARCGLDVSIKRANTSASPTSFASALGRKTQGGPSFGASCP